MTTNKTPASFGRRLLAVLTDNLIIGSFLLLAVYYVTSATDLSFLLQRSIMALLLIIIPTMIFSLFYYSWFVSQFGATLGKQIWGVSIVDEEHQLLSLKMAFFREFVAKAVSAFCLGLGYIWIIRDKDNQGWHDMLTGSYALQSKSQSVLFSVLILLAIMSLHIGGWILIANQAPELMKIFTDLTV